MPFKLVKINNTKVEPIKLLEKKDERPIKGNTVVSDVYTRIAIFGSPGQGKTSCMFKIMKDCADKNTTIVTFIHTVHVDPCWQAIHKYFDDEGIPFIAYNSIFEGGKDRMAQLVAKVEADATKRELKLLKKYQGGGRKSKKSPPADIATLLSVNSIPKQEGGEEEEEEDKVDKDDLPDFEENKKKKGKFQTPTLIVCIDDLAHEIYENPMFELLCRENRHFHVLLLVASQSITDISSGARKMMDIFILFGNMPHRDLENIYQHAGIKIGYRIFSDFYNDATEKHDPKEKPFFYFNKATNDFRRNFDEAFKPEKNNNLAIVYNGKKKSRSRRKKEKAWQEENGRSGILR